MVYVIDVDSRARNRYKEGVIGYKRSRTKATITTTYLNYVQLTSCLLKSEDDYTYQRNQGLSLVGTVPFPTIVVGYIH